MGKVPCNVIYRQCDYAVAFYICCITYTHERAIKRCFICVTELFVLSKVINTMYHHVTCCHHQNICTKCYAGKGMNTCIKFSSRHGMMVVKKLRILLCSLKLAPLYFSFCSTPEIHIWPLGFRLSHVATLIFGMSVNTSLKTSNQSSP